MYAIIKPFVIIVIGIDVAILIVFVVVVVVVVGMEVLCKNKKSAFKTFRLTNSKYILRLNEKMQDMKFQIVSK